MSKMPAKKKSCFQITSVTQAQVAASCVTDDTESLDDPDESRTEDVSSEIFDVSRADIDACERSSSEETLNHPFASGVHPLTVVSSPPAAPGSPGVAHAASVGTSCSSRFRVIKLDHGTGEPFRRGRWACTEFYERDSDSSAGRTVDGIRPAVSLDHGTDRDSGLGATMSSMLNSTIFSTQASESPTDSGYPLSLGPGLGSGASAFHPTGYTATSAQANANIQPVASQNFHSNGINGVHHGVIQTPPAVSPATQHLQQRFGSSALHAGLTLSQVPSPGIAGGPGAQGLSGEAGLAQGLLLQGGNAPVANSILQGGDQQQLASPTQPSGGIGAPLVTAVTTSTSHSSGESAPATATSLGGAPVQPQGTYGRTAQGLPSGFPTEDGRLKSDLLPPFGANMVSGRQGVKPFIGEGLDLPTPSVKSLFGISIAMNVDEDRASGQNCFSIPALTDMASGNCLYVCMFVCFAIGSNSNCTFVVLFQKHLIALNLQTRGRDHGVADMEEAVSQPFKQPVSEPLTGASENLDVISCAKGVAEINLSWPQIQKLGFKSPLSAQQNSSRWLTLL
ncbi:unnamed protein product [Tetraodon nigroviridis]|uniref:(spotted green pufferfish) hypothetical protein n=1 Tax=Tetraodon nigroviridis TaxID=99883 RepID=Q4RU47_TETNG|nr:unnamed protein product [Tetraodon nigroviridis]